jgi:ribosome maturation factor RimP
MSTPSTPDRLLRLLEPVVTAEGLDLEDVAVTPAGKRRVLRVTVDRDGGVSLDDIAELSQSISGALDSSDVMPGPYVLEVSSPGVGRPLTQPRHWRRAVTRLVRARLADGGEVTGHVREADETGVTVDVAGSQRRLAYPEIARAAVEVDFGRPVSPGRAERDENAEEA